MDRAGEAAVPGERVALGAHGVQHQELPVLTPQPRHQPRPQERGLARTRRTQDHEQRLDTGAAHGAQCIQTAHDLSVPAEEYRRVGFLERFPPPKGGPPSILRRRPGEVLGPDPCTAQPLVQPPEAVREKNNRTALTVNWNFGGGSVAEEVAALPFAGDAFLLQRL
ncbi:hypothetical protein SRABI83_03136 [Arthrobacter sp. Bi83]|nr:hypothetical protein SRABI83_03136 [Arthrobacter sp. Bi83]